MCSSSILRTHLGLKSRGKKERNEGGLLIQRVGSVFCYDMSWRRGDDDQSETVNAVTMKPINEYNTHQYALDVSEELCIY